MIFNETSVSWAILILLSSTLSLYISAYAYHRRHIHGAKALAFFMLSVALYSLGYALEINSESIEKIIDALKFSLFWATFTAPAFLLFVIQFINKSEPPLWHYAVLFAIPVAIGALALTNDQHTLIYQRYWIEQATHFARIRYQPGPAYILQLAFLILVSLLAELLLLLHLLRSRGTERTRTTLTLIAGVLPTLSAIINPDRETFGGLDLQPFVFAITGLLLAIALFYFKMLDLAKIAREYAVDAIHDYLLIIDKNRIVIDINQAGRESTLLHNWQTGKPLPEDSPFTNSLISHLATGYERNQQSKYSLQVDDRHYQYSFTAIEDSLRHIQGYVVLVNDYTRMANLLAEMEQLAITDSLTNIFNRRHFIHLAKREIKIATRTGASLSVMLFDLDNFKQLNDHFGHQMGDKVLKKVASVIQSQLRTTEIFGRYGGEEFCVICPNTAASEAEAIAERLRQSIEQVDWAKYGALSVTASFGIYTTSRLKDQSIKELLSRADSALYQAKSAGKNCVSQATQITAKDSRTPANS